MGKKMSVALNARLPEDICVKNVYFVGEDFHPRYSVTAKTYEYVISDSAVRDPFLKDRAWLCQRSLDADLMNKNAADFVGKHDFVSFAANPHRELETTVRNIYSFTVKKTGPRFVFTVRGDGFLYKQVRSMVGFLLAVGKGNEKPAAVKELLAAKTPRTARVETAPSRGLFLWKVFY
jgi:tRNA pseudouridine38-40 synthase